MNISVPVGIKSNIEIYDMDSINCAIHLINNGKVKNPLVLNLADNVFAGGCVNNGSGAQEESLFRRSNYYMTLLQSMYPIENNQAIYSPNVTVFKSSEDRQWALINPINLSFIACPAIRHPDVLKISNNCGYVKKFSDQNDVHILKNKIRLIINIASKHNHDCIVFSAMGVEHGKTQFNMLLKYLEKY